MPFYVTVSDVTDLHDRHIGAGVRDQGLLEGAVARPQSSAYGEDAFPDLHSKAAALFESLARKQVFIEGNKRTAVYAVGLFYSYNGWWLETDDSAILELADGVAQGWVKFDEIVERLKAMSLEIPDEWLPAEQSDPANGAPGPKP